MTEKKSTLLIVDDERLNLTSLVELFQDHYRVLVAKDGRQALVRARSEPMPDLILLDILMPGGLDGFEVCRHLKKDPKTRETPIIFITALHEEADQIHGFELGAVDFITKPFMPNVVKARVHTHLTLKAARSQLKEQNRALVAAAKLKEDVDQIMRHDLKVPLNGIIGLPQLLLMEDKAIDAECRETLRMIERSGYKMLRMINNSLDLYKMEMGSYPFKSEPVDLARLIRKIWSESRILTMVKGYVLKLIINGREDGGEDPFIVPGEELLCFSLMSNLIQNALEATKKGGVVTIHLDADEKNTVRIHNQGVVPAEIRDTFFEKYVTAGKSGGTGLGTYSARLMARTMRGDLFFQTDETTGTTLTVILPIREADDTPSRTVEGGGS